MILKSGVLLHIISPYQVDVYSVVVQSNIGISHLGCE